MNKYGFDPFKTIKQMSLQMEKQMNDAIHVWTDSKEFVGLSKLMNDYQVKHAEEFAKNQEDLYEGMNVPTKKDIKSLAALTIQTEEKVDTLEEQLWELQHSVDSVGKEMVTFIKVAKQLKTEVTKLRKEQEAAKGQLEIEELKNEIVFLKELIMIQAGLKEEEADAERLVAAGVSK
ncbi:polyhydroxyalkanoate biosynthesis repressor PhaR [bacterium LRH843]|nr:polyhydroxyalkanoate biosynthesis repressor PhaR [bacterium LRH843]